jgi:hypothetical protein
LESLVTRKHCKPPAKQKINPKFHGRLFHLSASREFQTAIGVNPQNMAVISLFFAFTRYSEVSPSLDLPLATIFTHQN